MRKSIYYLLLLLTFLAYGCSKIESDWKQTEEQNTLQAYQEFLLKYPNEKYSATAAEKIEVFKWQEALQKDTIEDYRAFLTEYPQSANAAEAKARIEKAEWQNATEANTIEAFTEFLQKYPQSEFASQANELIVELSQAKPEESEEAGAPASEETSPIPESGASESQPSSDTTGKTQ